MLFLISGDYKTGKTVSACTFPKPLLFLDFDNGFKSVEYTKKNNQYVVQDKDQITKVTFFKEQVSALNFMTTLTGARAPEYAKESASIINNYNIITKELFDTGKYQDKTYQTIVIDSLTSMFRIWKEAILHLNNIPNLRIPDYGTLEGILYNQFIPTLKALIGKKIVSHIVLIDHTETEKDEVTGSIIEYPIGPSKNMGKTMGMAFDEIYRQKVEGDKYVWRTKKTGFFQAGSRLNIPDGIEANYKSLTPYV